MAGEAIIIVGKGIDALTRRNMPGAVGARRKRPTRFVIPAGSAHGSRCLIAPSVSRAYWVAAERSYGAPRSAADDPGRRVCGLRAAGVR